MDDMPGYIDDNIETVRVRRAPKLSVFLLVGAAVGVLVALILTFVFDGSEEASVNTGLEYSRMQVFGFVTLVCVPVFLAISGLIAVWLDRRSSTHTREVVVDHQRIHIDED